MFPYKIAERYKVSFDKIETIILFDIAENIDNDSLSYESSYQYFLKKYNFYPKDVFYIKIREAIHRLELKNIIINELIEPIFTKIIIGRIEVTFYLNSEVLKFIKELKNAKY